MSQSTIRPAAVAGMFYPAAAETLRRLVYGFLEEARRRLPAGAVAPKAVIAPHAGYVYSGAIAAAAYARIAALRGRVTRVVLIGPCHRVAVHGLALPAAQAFDTPLGRVEVDAEACARVSRLPGVVVSAAAHAQDHALEVQLPFLQQALGRFTLVPLLAGAAKPDDVARVLEELWGGAETLVVISSDLSHYLPYEAAVREDRSTIDAVLALDDGIDHEHACGATAVNGLLQVARRRGLAAELLDLRNSGDTAGDKSRVVGYAAVAFVEGAAAGVAAGADNAAAGAPDQGEVLLGLARAAIGERLGMGAPGAGRSAAFLAQPGATFVTLKREGELRGCIGSLVAHRPLIDDVRHNACAAAFSDPRFTPLAPGEFAAIRIEVSLLDAPQPIVFASEADLLLQLRPLIDGVTLEVGTRRATFLPQVWETLPQPRDFLLQLKAKAGLPHGFWHEQMKVSRYTVRKWAES